MALGVAVIVLGLLLVAAPVPLTTRGALRRGHGLAMSVLSGLVFPLTWAAWYVVDERSPEPSRR